MVVVQDTSYGQLKADIDALENIQTTQILTDNSFVSKTWHSSNSYDALLYQTSTPERWLLRVGTVSGRNALVDMKFWYRLDNYDVMQAPQEPTSTTPIVTARATPRRPATQGVLDWEFTIYSNLSGYPPPHSIYFKFLFDATDDITFTFTKL